MMGNMSHTVRVQGGHPNHPFYEEERGQTNNAFVGLHNYVERKEITPAMRVAGDFF